MAFDITLLVFLFLILCVYADLVVKNIKIITGKLGLRLFGLGIILGIVTSLPEMAISLNAVVQDAVEISAGNLIGGTIVLFGLILGASLLLNRRIRTDGYHSTLLPEAGLIFLPLLLGLNGRFSQLDGAMILAAYVGVLYYLYRRNNHPFDIRGAITHSEKINRAVWLTIVGVITIMVVSHWIMRLAVDLIAELDISQFFVGVIFFAIGTNLPELSIAMTAWKRRAAELSLSNLIGSALTHIAILGMISSLKPIEIEINVEYFLVMVFLGLILTLFIIFFHTGKNLNRAEGAVLLALYSLFIIASFIWLPLSS